MGISLSWVATEALPANEALARLALTPTGNLVTFPFKGIATKPLPENWILVTAEGVTIAWRDRRACQRCLPAAEPLPATSRNM